MKALLSAMIPGCMLLIGLWGIIYEELAIDLSSSWIILPGLVSLTVGLLLRWNKERQVMIFLIILVAVLAAGIIFSGYFTASLAGLMELVSDWYLLRRGVYIPPFRGPGQIWLMFCLFSFFSGILVARILRAKTAIPVLIMTLVVSFAWILQYIQSGWFLALFFVGILLTISQKVSGFGKGLFISTFITASLGLVIVLLVNLANVEPGQGDFGRSVADFLHSVRYESVEPALPEGRLNDLGAFQPKDDKVLKLTMKKWQPQYIRGYVGGVYTKQGWKPIANKKLLNKADLFYTIQRDNFFPSTQISEAWLSLDRKADNGFKLENIGASKAYAYTPYAVGNIKQDLLQAKKLSTEGRGQPDLEGYDGDLFDLTKSYFLQKDLSSNSDTSYMYAEKEYRDWVYKNYLSIPKDVKKVLDENFNFSSGDVTSVQAKRDIGAALDKAISYRDGAVTPNHNIDFVKYVLEISREGYSVHYATLSTLMLRRCGIPARYVEGYVVPPEQITAMGSGKTLSIRQTNSRAWSEYYLDGVGWLPFDASPDFGDILSYSLPSSDQPSDNEGGVISQKSDKPQKNPPSKKDDGNKRIKIEEEDSQLGQKDFATHKLVILLLLLLALIAFLLRIFILRRRLKKKKEGFYEDQPRKAGGAIVCYIYSMADLMGWERENITIRKQMEDLANSYGNTDPDQATELIQRLWYSGHDLSEEDREMALKWLEDFDRTWQEATPGWKRFYQKYIKCKII